MADKRRAVRYPLMKAATIKYADGTINCIVRDLSTSGAALDVRNELEIPIRFVLAVPRERLQMACRVLWRAKIARLASPSANFGELPSLAAFRERTIAGPSYSLRDGQGPMSALRGKPEVGIGQLDFRKWTRNGPHSRRGVLETCQYPDPFL
jgi:hypothetical protein